MNLKTCLFIFALSLYSLFHSLADKALAKSDTTWQETLNQAKGQTVDWYMWGGSPAVNSYVNGYLTTELQTRFGITLRQVPVKDIAEIVSKIAVEKQAGKITDGSVDLMWINGENFRTCKKLELLHGPFTNTLPNADNLDLDSPALKSDFGTPVENFESPWGSSQLVMIYDSARTPHPPQSIPDLLTWIQENPGRFTYPAPPDFTGSAFIRHIFYHATGSSQVWQEPYSKADLADGADATFTILRDIKSSLWRGGETYPESPVKMDTLFADNEIDFSFSYQQGSASQNIKDGIFKDTVRTYVFDSGTISNTHFVAIPFNAKDKSGAMVVANFLLSPEAQLEKAKGEVWGDFPVIHLEKLSPEWQIEFNNLQKGVATLSDSELQAHQLPEPPSEILIFLEKGWQKQVLRNR
ncbi:ABC transporter substrate-binding protein [Desulforhopalus sp. 52FAK]